MIQKFAIPNAKVFLNGELPYNDLSTVALMYSNLGENKWLKLTLGRSYTILWDHFEELCHYNLKLKNINLNKLVKESLIILFANKSNILQEDIEDINGCSGKKIFFENEQNYLDCMENLIIQINTSIPMLCKLGIYDKE